MEPWPCWSWAMGDLPLALSEKGMLLEDTPEGLALMTACTRLSRTPSVAFPFERAVCGMDASWQRFERTGCFQFRKWVSLRPGTRPRGMFVNPLAATVPGTPPLR